MRSTFAVITAIAVLRAPHADATAAANKNQTVIELQKAATQTIMTFEDTGPENDGGIATLINLNPTVNTWYVLQVKWPGKGGEGSYHLENADPERAKLRLDQSQPTMLIVDEGTAEKACELFQGEGRQRLLNAAKGGSGLVPLCDDRVVLRVKIDNRKTGRAWLANHNEATWRGEERVNFVDDDYVKPAPKGPPSSFEDGAPPAADVSDLAAKEPLPTNDLRLPIAKEPGGTMLAGNWYESKTQDGVYVSQMRPRLVSDAVANSYPDIAGKIDAADARSPVYLVAFDLSKFGVKFTTGTEHPSVGWSSRAAAVKASGPPAGPDGFEDVAPLVRSGMVDPAEAGDVIAAFTAGFKRAHGAFKEGALAKANHGSHYGFVENGIVLSALVPGLATLFVTKDGTVNMREWTEADDALLPTITFARQNGVPLVVTDEKVGTPAPGAFVNNWGLGNWSGSASGALRSIRSGVCLREAQGKRYLMYGWFQAVTPPSMARVFQAYGCKFAMHLDMNALEHTYLALYGKSGRNMSTDHLIAGMEAVDIKVNNKRLPRFLGFSDDRDFFYLMPRK